jgi:hypothetical protein
MFNRKGWIPGVAAVLGASVMAACSSLFMAEAPPTWDEPGLLKDFKIDRSAVTYFVDPHGDDANDGRSAASPFLTMQKGVDALAPGETLLVMKGTYPAGFRINKQGRPDAWFTILAEPGVEIRGSDPEKNWVLDAPETQIYRITRPDLIGFRQTPETELVHRVEQVFVNGQLLRQVPQKNMLKPRNVFYVDDLEKKLYACLKDGADPNQQDTEVSRRTWAIQVGGPANMNYWHDPKISEESKASYIRINGFRIRNLANFSRQAAIQVRGICHDIIIENCDVQWVNFDGISARAMNIWSPAAGQWLLCPVDRVTIRHCVASNCGVGGIGTGGANQLLVESNILDDNNYKDMSPWAEGGACKIGFEGRDLVIRNNVARNNNNHGLWVDNGDESCVFENNFVLNSISAAVLDECTPMPPTIRLPDGQVSCDKPPVAEVKANVRKGTIIRNNVLIGTRTPVGNGIYISTSCDSQVYNNVIYRCDGAAIAMAGGVGRPDAVGLARNRAWSNICLENFYHVALNRSESDQSGRTFDNVLERNLFIGHRGRQPFKVDDQPVGQDLFDQANPKAQNTVSDQRVFADPEKFDFRIVDADLAAGVGFDAAAMRLDWSAYFLPPQQSEKARRNLDYFPVDLSTVFNRALTDETAGDGQGGWTDQGPNDMSLLPNGKQTLDGVEYWIGTKDNGAVMLPCGKVKTAAPLSRSINIPVDKSLDELFFLYTAAWADDTEKVNGERVIIPNPVAAEFTVTYADGTREMIQVLYGKHLLDWWMDPSWQQHALLNDNQVYVAWQGPNRSVGKVVVFARQWSNPHPEKRIASITLGKENARIDCAFALLGITGATPKKNPASPPLGAKNDKPAFLLNYDGDMDAIGSDGSFIEPATKKVVVFSAGTFEPGMRGGKSFRPKQVVRYPVPADFPLAGEGTVSLWLKADDWTTPEQVKVYSTAPYRRKMTPFSADSAKERYSCWELSFEVSDKDNKTLFLAFRISGISKEGVDVTSLVTPGKWFNASLVWRVEDNRTVVRAYLDGKEVASVADAAKASLIGDWLYPAIAGNGGHIWNGTIDEIKILKKARSIAEIRQEVELYNRAAAGA